MTVSKRSVVAVRYGLSTLVALSMALFAMSVPARYGELAETGRQAAPRVGNDLLRRALSQDVYAIAALSLEVLFVLSLALAAAAVLWRNRSDWRPLFFAAAFVTYAVWVTPTLDALTLPSVFRIVSDLTQAAGLIMAIHFFMLFPDGRFVPGWARLNALFWSVYCLAWGFFPGMPLTLKNPFEASFGAFLTLMLLGWALGLVAQTIRYRRASPRQRAQTKWVLLVVAGACVAYACVYLPDVFLPASGGMRLLYDLFSVPLFWLLAVPMPIAFVIAMLRYSLFDVDLIINRTLVYTTLTATLVLVYISVVVLLQTVFRTGLGNDSQLVVVASTLAVAALFNPLRARIQSFIDRRFYRRKYDAVKTLERFSAKLRDGTDLDSLGGDLVAVLTETVQPEWVGLWIRPSGGGPGARGGPG